MPAAGHLDGCGPFTSSALCLPRCWGLVDSRKRGSWSSPAGHLPQVSSVLSLHDRQNASPSTLQAGQYHRHPRRVPPWLETGKGEISLLSGSAVVASVPAEFSLP